jgi:two-component system, chemotaxis family, chemotaxis protein CheY
MMNTVLIVDDSSMCREPLMRVLQLSGYTCSCAVNGDEAIKRLQTGDIGLLLLDLNMPGMNGLELLRRIRTDAKLKTLPVIVLTGSVNRQNVLEARELGVCDYLLKASFALDDLLTRIGKYIGSGASMSLRGVQNAVPVKTKTVVQLNPAPKASRIGRPIGQVSPIMSREQTLERIRQFTGTKTLAGVVSEVIAMTASPRTGVNELIPLLKRDPVVCARVLQVANTAKFTTQKAHIATLEEAVRNVGINAVRNIATSAGVFDSCPSDGADGFNVMRCWQHCFAVAAIMDLIVPADGLGDDAPAAIAHIVGLCHDLGEIVLRQCLAKEYAAVAELSETTGQLLHEVESVAFGVTHRELTDLVVTQLRLPAPVIEPIREYHLSAQSGRTLGLSRMAQALRLADLYAHGLLLASSPHAPLCGLTTAECKEAIGKTPLATIDGAALRGEVLTHTSLLARLPRTEEMAISKPFFPQSGMKVWYARHASLDTHDPIGAVLGLIAATATHDRLPVTPSEVGGHHAIVVATPKHSLMPFPPHANMSTVGGGTVPVLYLCGESPIGSSPIQGIEFMQYPIPLSKVAEFISVAATQNTSAADNRAA